MKEIGPFGAGTGGAFGLSPTPGDSGILASTSYAPKRMNELEVA